MDRFHNPKKIYNKDDNSKVFNTNPIIGSAVFFSSVALSFVSSYICSIVHTYCTSMNIHTYTALQIPPNRSSPKLSRLSRLNQLFHRDEIVVYRRSSRLSSIWGVGGEGELRGVLQNNNLTLLNSPYVYRFRHKCLSIPRKRSARRLTIAAKSWGNFCEENNFGLPSWKYIFFGTSLLLQIWSNYNQMPLSPHPFPHPPSRHAQTRHNYEKRGGIKL